MAEVAILDYGVGNLLSVERALQHLGIPTYRTNNEKEVFRASHLILPGVGAFGAAISVLNENNLDHVVKQFARTGKPVLGICLGMQLLFNESHEFGLHAGLGLIPGAVKPIAGAMCEKEKIPSIGWKNLTVNNGSQNPFLITTRSYFYFVHSFMGIPDKSTDLIATYQYGGVSIPAIVRRDNVIGVQFHPEKSAQDGLELIRKFSSL
jgi:glutamine amidotransferase